MAEPGNHVTVVDFRVPFWRLVLVLLKVALAAIPASILFVIIVWGTIAILQILGLGMAMRGVRV
jgi:hypothetical protein